MMKKIHKISFVSLAIVFVLTFFLFPSLHNKPVINYAIVYITSSLLFILMCWFILKNNISAKYIFSLIAVALILRIVLISLHPIGSDDYYRYVWDGKVLANGINPYEFAPNDTALTKLLSSIIPARVNNPDMKTIYPPLAQLLFYVSYRIGGESYIGIKLLLFLFDLMTMFGIFLIIKKLKFDYKNILIYVLSPLPVFQFFIDAHVDGFGLPLLIFAIFFYIDNKKTLSYIFIGLSICVKPLGLILLPIIFFNEKDFSERIKAVIIPVLITALMYLPFVFTGSPFQALMQFTENWTFNGIIFDLLDSFIRDNQRTRLICAALLMISYLPVILSKKDFTIKVYLSLFLLFIFSPIVHPWYLSWLVILLPFIPRWSGIVYTGVISLTVFTVVNYQLYGIWKEYNLVLFFEYVPVLSLFLYEMLNKKPFIRAPLMTQISKQVE
ncbi:MAG: glycosyltransferase 87 family protein [Ignavibacteriaceae bacterium]